MNLYGIEWNTRDEALVEAQLYRNGGYMTVGSKRIGNGPLHHFKRLVSLLCPWFSWNVYSDLMADAWANNGLVGIAGPASCGKTYSAGVFAYAEFFAMPRGTSIIMSSITIEGLRLRVWGAMCEILKRVQERRPGAPGYIVHSERRIYPQEPTDEELRDPRDAIMGIACKVGDNFVGVGCFPAGTMVDTITGPVPIEKIKAGDFVLSAIGYSKVLGTSVRNTSVLCKVHLSDGRTITCTPNHRFFTQKGWINALTLSESSYMLSAYESMRIVRCRDKWQTSFLQSLLFSEMDAQAYARASGAREGEIREDINLEKELECCESGKGGVDCVANACISNSGEHSIESCKDESKTDRDEMETSCEGRERNRSNEGGITDHGMVPRCVLELPCEDQEETRNWISNQLQGGCCIRGSEASNRSGRREPFFYFEKGEGCEEGFFAKGAWVDRIEIEELSDSRSRRNNKADNRVYNLHVDGHPSYSVNGLLAHNSYVGIKNANVIGIFDEVSLMPASFWDAISNLKKNPRTKFVAMGNPKDHYDALGKICEPDCGWDSLPESTHSRSWKTRAGGVAIQLSGLDTPNGTASDGSKCAGLNRFPYLITPEQIEQDKQMYGEDSWQFQMMDLGVFPKSASVRRVITREICEKGNAFGEPLWDGRSATADYVGIDAAYSGVGGDRTPLVHIRTGRDINGVSIVSVVNGPLLIPTLVGLKDDEGKPVPIEQQIVSYVMDYCRARSIYPSHVGYDSTGRGSLAHAFALIWARDTVPVEFGGLPLDDRKVLAHAEKSERDEYGKMVSALWFAWRNLIVQGQMRKLPMSVFEEGTMREYCITKSGKTDVEPKEDTKKRLGRSPDLADALCVAIEVARRNGFVVGKATGETVARSVKWIEEKKHDWSALRQGEVLVEA